MIPAGLIALVAAPFVVVALCCIMRHSGVALS
jgi:hypothetical protein